MACLVVDVGNTSTSVARWDRGKVTRVRRLTMRHLTQTVCREATHSSLGGRDVDGAIVASVVPAANSIWRRAIRAATGSAPIFVDHTLRLGVRIDYPRPRSIGADRLANAAGAIDRYGAPVVVADFGTAVTFDIVSADGAYIGGIIAPGLPLMADYLADRTAMLPRIRVRGPHGAIGRSTVGAMRVGAKIGYRGMVREIAEHIESHLGLKAVTLCATGGFAAWALEGMAKSFVVDPTLTLHGLGVVYELNREDV